MRRASILKSSPQRARRTQRNQKENREGELSFFGKLIGMAILAQTCANHPDRPGRALCMQCRKTVCLECATQWDGINYCVNCLKKKREATREPSSVVAWAVMLLLIAGLFAAGSLGMVWSGELAARMFAF